MRDVEPSPHDHLEKQVKRLQELWPRETGNREHARFVDDIKTQLKKMQLEQRPSLSIEVYSDTLRFERWCSTRCTLEVHRSGVTVASAYPYSGCTDTEDVEEALQLFRCGQRHRWKDSAGKIAVIEVPYPSLPVELFLDEVGHLPASARPHDFLPPTYTYAHPVLAATVFGPDLAAAKAAGAKGVVAVWKGLTAAQAEGQYVPFTFPYQDIPAVWVACDESSELLESARRGDRATLKLKATLSSSATTETVWAVVEGEGEIASETVLVVTHTDGGNGVEENGAIGVLDLVRMFATEPRPKRTLVFVFVTGHLRSTIGNQATTEWLKAHPEWWSGKKKGDRRAVAGLVIEHLGALKKARPETGYEVELTYATNAKMQEILEKCWADVGQKRKVLIARPGLIHLGEGEPLYKHRIPAIALASVPEYLLATTNVEIVDVNLMREQIGAFACALRELESYDAEQLGRAERGLIRKIRSVVQFLLFIARNRSLVFHLSAFMKAEIGANLWGRKSLLTFVNTRPV